MSGGARRDRLVLVDGSSYLFRAFHALPPLSNSRGEPTGAVYGVTNMLLKLLREYEPAFVAVVFDASGKTFRDELYEEYKAQRPPMPNDLRVQLEPLREIVRALGLPLLRVDGVEADDVIGTLARRADDAGMDTLVSTIDKDMTQLVGEHVAIVDTMFDRTLDRDHVNAKYGVEPAQMVDYLALVGDSSDNIPGVAGVGAKTAAALLQHFGSIDRLYEHPEEVAEVKVRGAGKLAEKLEQARDAVELSRRLATIVCDVELPFAPRDLVRERPDYERLRELYTRLELRSLLSQLPDAPQPEPARDDDPGYRTVLEQAQLDTLLKALADAKRFALDVEGDQAGYMEAQIVGLGLAIAAGEAWYLPLGHAGAEAPPQLDRDATLESLRPLLEDPDVAKIGHRLKHDGHLLANHGIGLAGAAHDTALESYVLDSTVRHDLDGLAARHLHVKTTSYEEVAGKGAKQLPFEEVGVEAATAYAAQNADLALRVHDSLREQLERIPPLERLYHDIEQPLLPVLQRMERAGVLVDRDMLAQQGEELSARIGEIQEQAFAEAGGAFNLDSPKQLQEILFDRLGLPVIRRTPKRQPSTAEDVLAELAHDYPLPQLVLDYRSLNKLRSTYIEKLPSQISPRTGRIHTSYHQAVAATGRLSSSEPNLQNIPIRTAEGRRIRRAFVAPAGYRLLAADYSQIELRIMAHLSGDEGLLGAFAEERDIHQATAAEVFGLAPEDVEPDQRRAAKAINFGLIYGMSAFGLARQLGIGRGDAQSYVDLYFERYPGVKRYMDDTRELARQQGYVETVFGRRLYLPEIGSRNRARRQYAERSAINAPMQGTAADIIKRSMIALDAWLAGSGVDARLIMQVHDELVFEVAEDAVDEVRAGVVERMSAAAELRVELEVDTGAGGDWDEAH